MRRPSPGKVSDAGSERTPTSDEMTTLEKIWGKMFEDGKPTPRLSQLLRGIAVHLVIRFFSPDGKIMTDLRGKIEDHHPENTFVVIPEKMQKYYSMTRVATDTYPWHGE